MKAQTERLTVNEVFEELIRERWRGIEKERPLKIFDVGNKSIFFGNNDFNIEARVDVPLINGEMNLRLRIASNWSDMTTIVAPTEDPVHDFVDCTGWVDWDNNYQPVEGSTIEIIDGFLSELRNRIEAKYPSTTPPRRQTPKNGEEWFSAISPGVFKRDYSH